MIGFLIVTHYQLASEFLRAVTLIRGPLDHFRAVGLDPQETPEEMRARIEKAIHEADQGHGVLLLVDMFGGTPSNLSLAFLDEERVEVVTGVNLPMLVKMAGLKDGLTLEETAELARDYGRKNISVASEILHGDDQGTDA